MAHPYLMKDSFISITIGSKAYSIDNTHQNFNEVREAIKEERWDDIQGLIDMKPWFEQKVREELGDDAYILTIDFAQEIVMYAGTPVHNTLTRRIFKMWKEGFEVGPMVAFLENLLHNPSSTAVKELYDFMETGNMPITEDGCFLAYKKIRKDYMDIYSGTIDNSVGNICEMPRNLVDDKRENTCSRGLHFCSQTYLPNYGGAACDTRVVIVKINPADVVSIPADYNNTKGRTWRYEVYAEVDSTAAHTAETFERSVYPSNETVPDEDEYEDWGSGDNEFEGSEYDDIDINFVREELGTHTNTELVKVFNDLTNSNLVKFRDKDTAIARIAKWISEGSSESVRDLRMKLVVKALTNLQYNRFA